MEMDSLIVANAILVNPENSTDISIDLDLEKNDPKQKDKKRECCCECKNANQRGACICIDCKCHLRKRMESHEQKGLEKEMKYLGVSILCTTLILLGIYVSRVLQ
jgi:hypothetical protein